MRLLEAALAAVNLEEMRQFYCGIFGFRELEPYWTGRLAVEVGRTRLIFVPPTALDRTAPPDWSGRYHFAFDVPPSRFEAALHWLRERTGLIASPEGQTRFRHESWNADAVYFRDPQGNILEIIARRNPAGQPAPPIAQETDRPFQSSEIMAVTEIGLAVGSVVDAVAQLTERMPGLRLVDDQPGVTQSASSTGAADIDFAAVGNIHGLFIVVRQGRIWFPHTSVPATPLPVDLLVELEVGQRYRVNTPPFPFTIAPI